MLKSKGGFVVMILSVLGIVLFVTLFGSVMGAFDDLLLVDLTDFIALTTVIGIAPVILLLGGIFGAGFAYWRGYKSASGSGSDPGGLLRMVLGVLVIILFVTLFATIAESFGDLFTLYDGDTNYIAFDTVLTIVPTILFLGGIFAGIGTSVGGARARSRRRALA